MHASKHLHHQCCLSREGRKVSCSCADPVTLPSGHRHADPSLPKARTPLDAGQAGGWYLSLAVRERGQSANLGVPISRGEFAVLRALANVRPAARLRAGCRS